MDISVCMATYNGEKYVLPQIRSILEQLDKHSELIIVDDFSKDKTIELIESIEDKRIKIYKNNSNQGHVKTFEIALNKAKGETIFLSDQDDIWPKNRVKDMLCECKEKKSLVIGQFQTFKKEIPKQNFNDEIIISSEINLFFFILKIFLGKENVFGSTMCFPKEYLNLLLKFPKLLEAHDIWIALVSAINGRVTLLNNVVVYRRLHELNVTPIKRRNLITVFISRLKLTFLIILAIFRKKKK